MHRRLSGLIWGSSGTGKTTLACTAPGRKLLVSFDPDGDQSVGDWPDVDVVDMSAMTLPDLRMFENPTNPLGLLPHVDRYDTFIFDSLTSVAYKGLMKGIELGQKYKTKPTIYEPGQAAYGARNALVHQLVKNALLFTGRHNKHCFFVAHESPINNDEGVVMYITLALGGKLPTEIPVDFSEVWNLDDLGLGRNRRLMTRPCRGRKPMKTRMFETTGDPEFDWYFNPDDLDDPHNMRISDWYKAYTEGGNKKMQLPVATAKPSPLTGSKPK